MIDPVSILANIVDDRPIPEGFVARLLRGSSEPLADPWEPCRTQFGLSETEIALRIGQILNVRVMDAIPRWTVRRLAPSASLDGVAGLRAIRGQDGGRPVLYAAPSFGETLLLLRRLQADPALGTDLVIVPLTVLRQALAQLYAEPLNRFAQERLSRRWPSVSARRGLSVTSRILFVGWALTACSLVAASPFVWQPTLLPLVALVLVAPAMLRLGALLPAPNAAAPPPLLADADLPLYSVLVPLRDEADIVAQLCRALAAFDYPATRLDIKFVVEAKSNATSAALRQHAPAGAEIIEVPDSRPRTKPKALDFALPLVRGSYVVVFDAEDIPDPQQLRLAASTFAARPDLDCLQAELVIDNSADGWLAALFAGEYAGQFGFMLPALARWGFPMPLGGTSNHFRSAALREAGGWDPFNVTEDADLGVRLARLRYRCGILPSRTGEEAPNTLRAWMKQRTRWMKGWMLTFVVHNRSPRTLVRDLGWRGALGFEVYVGSQIISSLLHTIFVVTSVWRLALGLPLWGGDGLWGLVFGFVLLFGYGGALAIVAAGLIRLGRPQLLPLQLLLPVYWLLHAAATLLAAKDLLLRPFFWSKTTHGRTRQNRAVPLKL